ncbi:hypothetical protein JYK22_17270, partial [Nonomuraea sp. RK-328]|nr:hypothetical protein [Nonomuraea sp. RK-328]
MSEPQPHPTRDQPAGAGRPTPVRPPGRRRLRPRLRAGLAAVLTAVLTAGAVVALPGVSHAESPPIDLDDAAGFAVLADDAVVNTNQTTVTGDLGVSPGTTVTGFPPGTVDGTIH